MKTTIAACLLICTTVPGVARADNGWIVPSNEARFLHVPAYPGACLWDAYCAEYLTICERYERGLARLHALDHLVESPSCSCTKSGCHCPHAAPAAQDHAAQDHAVHDHAAHQHHPPATPSGAAAQSTPSPPGPTLAPRPEQEDFILPTNDLPLTPQDVELVPQNDLPINAVPIHDATTILAPPRRLRLLPAAHHATATLPRPQRLIAAPPLPARRRNAHSQTTGRRSLNQWKSQLTPTR